MGGEGKGGRWLDGKAMVLLPPDIDEYHPLVVQKREVFVFVVVVVVVVVVVFVSGVIVFVSVDIEIYHVISIFHFYAYLGPH